MYNLALRLFVILVLELSLGTYANVTFANGAIFREAAEQAFKKGADDVARINARKTAVEANKRSAKRQLDEIAKHNAAKANQPVIQSVKQPLKSDAPNKAVQVNTPLQTKILKPDQPKKFQLQKRIDIRSIKPKTADKKIDDIPKTKHVNNSEAQSAKQAASLKEHLRQSEKYGKSGAKELQNGKTRYYGETNSATNLGEMASRRTVREFDSATGNKRTWHETLDHNGNVRQIRPELNNGTKTHYIFDKNGNYTGSR